MAERLRSWRASRAAEPKLCKECGEAFDYKYRGRVCEKCKYKLYDKLEYMQSWREAHREQDRRYAKEYRQRNLETVRRRGSEHGWRLRGIKNFTYADYERLSTAQSNLCAICKRPNPGKRKLGVDHNHRTGEARELLCSRCNHVVGVLESSHVLPECLRYLVKWNGVPDYQI
jgi:hypothetical protein